MSLYAKNCVFALGVMTGTSCDGADLALLKLAPSRLGWKEELVAVSAKKFPAAMRKRLRSAQRGNLGIRETALLTRDYSSWSADFIKKSLASWQTPLANTFIAFHGQTVWHEPEEGISVQLANPAQIAQTTGCTTISAFRQPDLACGGQGAPLVPYYHWLRATEGGFNSWMPFSIHNIGGISNLTYVSKDIKKLEAFDTGPGNALIDLAVEKATRGKMTFDRNGAIAFSALDEIDWSALQKLSRLSFFKKRPPKSTGRELFNEEFLAKIPGDGAALVANATAFTALTMAKAYADFILGPSRPLKNIFLAGGGAMNHALVSLFERELFHASEQAIPVFLLPGEFAPAQFLEAMAFARLGFEALRGRKVSLSQVTGADLDAKGAGIFPGENFDRLMKLSRV